MFGRLTRLRGVSLIVGGSALFLGCDQIRRGRLLTTVLQPVQAAENNESHNAPEAEPKFKLKGLIVFFRHGARTPLRQLVGIEEANFDKNFFDGVVPHAEVPIYVQSLDGGERPSCRIQQRYQQQEFKGGMPAGQLTKLGKEQAYILGRRLRQKYGEEMQFLPREYFPEDVYLRSSNIHRCVESMQATLGGLFGRKAFIDPAIIEVAMDSEELLYPNTGSCNSLRKMGRQVPMEMEEFQDYVQVVKKVQSITGDDSAVGRFDMMQHRDHLVARKAHGLAVPQWMLDMEQELEWAAVKHIKQYVKGPVGDHHLVLMLSCGRILDMLQRNLRNIANELPSAKKLYLYSCHDTSLIPILLSLGCFDNKWPNYAADIVFEVYEDDSKEHWIKVLYEGKEQILNGSSTPIMPLDKFTALVKPFSLNDVDYKHKCSDLKVAKQYSAFWEAALQPTVVDTPPSI